MGTKYWVTKSCIAYISRCTGKLQLVVLPYISKWKLSSQVHTYLTNILLPLFFLHILKGFFDSLFVLTYLRRPKIPAVSNTMWSSHRSKQNDYRIVSYPLGFEWSVRRYITRLDPRTTTPVPVKQFQHWIILKPDDGLSYKNKFLRPFLNSGFELKTPAVDNVFYLHTLIHKEWPKTSQCIFLSLLTPNVVYDTYKIVKT